MRQLGGVIWQAEMYIVTRIERDIYNLINSIDSAMLNNSAINPTFMPMLSYLLENKQTSFIKNISLDGREDSNAHLSTSILLGTFGS